MDKRELNSKDLANMALFIDMENLVVSALQIGLPVKQNMDKIRALGIDLGTTKSAAAEITWDPASGAPITQGGIRTMPVDEGLMRQTDDSASQAKAEIEQNIDNLSARDVINWWTKWFLKTGHKRLSHILIAIGKTESD